MSASLLGANEIRELAAELDVTPTKKLGQNFVHDPNTVRRIVAASGVGARVPGATAGAGGAATGAVWAEAASARPAATTRVTTLHRGARQRPAKETEARVLIIVIRGTIGGWRRLKKRARRGI